MVTATEKTAPKKAAAKKKLAEKQAKSALVKKNRFIASRPDIQETAILRKVGRTGATNAIRASKALGLSITYMEKGVIIKEQSNGDKEIIAKVSRSVTKNVVGSLKKGMIFHAKN